MSAQSRNGPPLRRPYLLLRQPGCVGERLLDVLPLEVQVPLEDFLHGRPMGELTHNHGNGNPHPANSDTTAHDRWIKRASLKDRH
jgi:hypothetical protein